MVCLLVLQTDMHPLRPRDSFVRAGGNVSDKKIERPKITSDCREKAPGNPLLPDHFQTACQCCLLIGQKHPLNNSAQSANSSS